MSEWKDGKLIKWVEVDTGKEVSFDKTI